MEVEVAAAPVILLLPRVPRSVNAKLAGPYIADLRQRARRAAVDLWSEARRFVRICYFHRGLSTIDVDNMSKPIVDALRGIIYTDDQQVVVRLAMKIRTDLDRYHLDHVDSATDTYHQLVSLLTREDHVLCVEIGEIDVLRFVVGSS